jgi:hypothetical protein
MQGTCHCHRVAQVAHAQGADEVLVHDLGLKYHIASLEYRPCSQRHAAGCSGERQDNRQGLFQPRTPTEERGWERGTREAHGLIGQGQGGLVSLIIVLTCHLTANNRLHLVLPCRSENFNLSQNGFVVGLLNFKFCTKFEISENAFSPFERLAVKGKRFCTV